MVRVIGIYCASLLILFLLFYFNERSKVGALPRRTIFVMAQLAALFALVPAALYAFIRVLPLMAKR